MNKELAIETFKKNNKQSDIIGVIRTLFRDINIETCLEGHNKSRNNNV